MQNIIYMIKIADYHGRFNIRQNMRQKKWHFENIFLELKNVKITGSSFKMV